MLWKWDFQNDGIYDAFIQNPSFTYDEPGDYSVKLVVINATTADSTIKENYITVVMYNGIICLEKTKESGIVIYPNPVNDFLNIQIISNNFDPYAEIKITDIHGKLTYSSQIYSKKSCINIQNLIPGIYFAKVKFNSRILLRKLIIY